MLDCKFIGLDAAQKSMAVRAKKLEDRKKLNAQAVTVIDGWIQRNFKSEGQLAQGGWEPLQASTIKARKRGGDKILQDTGTLRSRWKHLYTADKAAVQSGVNYGHKHEFGKGKMERRILPTEEQIMPLLLKIYNKFVETNLKK